MARADIKTWLSLDEWGKILGINPLSLNQLFSTNLFPNNNCEGVFFSEAFNNSDRVSRYDLALAIQAAEQEISQEVGFNLLPDWTYDERLAYPRPGQPGFFGAWGTNPQGYYKTVEALRGKLISGGVKAKTLIQAGATVTRTDVDVDNYAETATVIVATTLTDINEIHAYYPAQSGSDLWEIRPISVAISGGFATITFKSWQISAANQQGSLDPQPMDAALPASYETTVDVYRVYNDPASQVTFLWEGGGCGTCAACQFGTQDGCFHLRDARIGILAPAPGTWSASTSEFTSTEWSVCREPDQVKLYYYSGNIDYTLPRPYVEMSPYWKNAVAFYAASKLDRPVCGCSNVGEYIEKWRRDAMLSSEPLGNMTITPEFASNRLGTSAGALYAYRRIHQNGIRVNK